MNKMLNMAAYILCAIGAINWGLVAFLKLDLVQFVTSFVGMPQLNNILYGLIALCGVYVLLMVFGLCGKCEM